jgi:hypothetical protein
MIGVVIDLLLFVGAIVLITKHKKPNRGALLVVLPGRKFNRLQRLGLTFAAMGVVLTAGIQIINSFHPMEPNYRAGLLGGSEGYVLVGAVMYLIGWIRRRKPESSSLD